MIKTNLRKLLSDRHMTQSELAVLTGIRACLVSDRARTAQSDFSSDCAKISQRSNIPAYVKKFGGNMTEKMQARCVRSDTKQALICNCCTARKPQCNRKGTLKWRRDRIKRTLLCAC